MPYLTALDTKSYSTEEKEMADIDVEDLLSRLTLKEKVMLTAGKWVIPVRRVLANVEPRQRLLAHDPRPSTKNTCLTHV